MNLYLDLQYSGDVPTVVASGDVDIHTAPLLEECFQRLAMEGHREVRVDLGAVSYLDSEGLKVLVKLLKLMGEGATVTISGARGTVRRVFEISGLNTIFHMIDSF